MLIKSAAGTWRDGVVFSCAEAAQRRESNSGSVISLLLGIWRDSAPGLVEMFVSCIMGSDHQLVWLLTVSLSQPEWLVLLMFRHVKEVLGCFPSTSTFFAFLSYLLLSFSPSGAFLPELSLQMRAEISAFRFYSTPKVSPRSRASPAAWGWYWEHFRLLWAWRTSLLTHE